MIISENEIEYEWFFIEQNTFIIKYKWFIIIYHLSYFHLFVYIIKKKNIITLSLYNTL